MASSRIVRLGTAVALTAALLLLAGCASPRPLAAPAAPAAAAAATTATGAPASAGAVIPPSALPGESGASSGASATAKGKGLAASDAKTLDAELSAIQGELDKMKAPSDSDFNAISSGLK